MMTKAEGGKSVDSGLGPGAKIASGGRNPNAHRGNAGGPIAGLKRGFAAAAK